MTQHLLAQAYSRETVATEDHVTLDYEARFLRRKLLRTDGGQKLLVDLPQVTSLEQGGHLITTAGRAIGIRAAAEPLLQVRGENLARLAWHIGNRHTPCQVGEDHLLIRRDHVIEAMLNHQQAEVHAVEQAFTPEGGAYGHGRTQPHEHGHSLHSPSATHSHDHTHDLPHDH